jgi:hypothetical protein
MYFSNYFATLKNEFGHLYFSNFFRDFELLLRRPCSQLGSSQRLQGLVGLVGLVRDRGKLRKISAGRQPGPGERKERERENFEKEKEGKRKKESI